MMRQPLILIVEDSDTVAQIQERVLGAARPPYQLRRAANGEEALKLLRSTRSLPDLVLLDLNMPTMDGREVLRAIRADVRLSRVPVAVFTVSEDEQDRIDSLALGATSYMVKPAGLAEFQRTLLTVAEYLTGPGAR